MNELWIYGPIPPQPSGGVSTFVGRLVRSGTIPIAGVVDPYLGRKSPIPAEHIKPDRPGAKERLRITFQLLKFRQSPLLINASRPLGALALAPFLTGRRAPTFLILHHGELKVSGYLARAVLRVALSRYTRIGCLSEAQQEFYLALGVRASQLVLIDPYIPPTGGCVEEGAEPLRSVLSWLRKTEGPVILSSGYAQEYYHHDWVLDAIEADRLRADARYLICCYGPVTPLLTQLAERASRMERVHIAYGLGPDEFHYILKRAHIYVRPSDIDSFGIAAWDAATEGLQVVASDASRRPPTSLVHPVNDRDGFLCCLRNALDPCGTPVHSTSRNETLESIASFLSRMPAES